jgi:hypothetical protein
MPSELFITWWNAFQRTGVISPLQLGCSHADLISILGEPDDVGGTSRKYPTPTIWKYCDLEFHFEKNEDALCLIYAESSDGVPRLSIPRSKTGC